MKNYNYLEYLGLCFLEALTEDDINGSTMYKVLKTINPGAIEKLTENCDPRGCTFEDEKFINFMVYVSNLDRNDREESDDWGDSESAPAISE